MNQEAQAIPILLGCDLAAFTEAESHVYHAISQAACRLLSGMASSMCVSRWPA